MRNNKWTNQQPDPRDPWDRGTYQTGFTDPPKNHNALVPILLVAIIFLAGVSSILGYLNIRLFVQLNQHQKEPVSLSIQDGTLPDSTYSENPPITAAPDGAAALGFQGEALVTFYQRYYRLPPGMYITHVLDGSDAACKGMREGDILISLDGTAISDMASLEEFLKTKKIGDQVEARIYRSKQQFTVTLTVEEAEA